MGVLAVAAAGLGLAVAAHQPGRSPASAPRDPSSLASAYPDTGSAAGSAQPARSAPPPVHLRIPAIGVSARVTGLGLNPDRTVEVPRDPATTGWYRLGPRPGAEGSAVILGHVDSVDGPAVFSRLRFLVPGDRIVVGAADGSAARFEVTEVTTYPNEQFPADRVYGPHGREHALQLVTCGGDYDPESGYQANVVVYTRLVSGGG